MKNLSKIFWDTRQEDLDFEKQSDFVISRVLEHGYLDDIKWLLKKYSKEKIKKALYTSRNLSEKTANFWSNYFNIPKQKILCLKKHYLNKQKILWPY